MDDQASAGITYSLRSLLMLTAILGVMAASLRIPSPLSVLVMLTCVVALLGCAARSSFFSLGMSRRMLAAAAIGGFSYLFYYVAMDTTVESWVNAVALVPFAYMKQGAASMNSDANLIQLANSTEFHYFQQKVHLLLAVVTACTLGYLAGS